MNSRKLGRAGLKVHENLKSLEVVPKLTAEVMAGLDQLFPVSGD